MADRYVWGTACRISPEAPVPVLMAKNESLTLGGAGNVAQNLFTLNAKVSLCGVVGNDATAKSIFQLLKNEKIDATGIVPDEERPSTLKTRIMAGNHQLLRVDREKSTEISKSIEDKLFSKIKTKIAKADVVMLSDYNKGLLNHSFSQKIISQCNENNKKVIVDPKGLHYEKYKGSWLIKPNKKELAEATNTEKIENREDVIKAARKLLSKTKSNHLVVTLSEDGLALISKKSFQNFPVRAQEVFDVTGAGDTVFASLGYFLSLGLDIAEACELANFAAAIAVSKVGSVAVTLNEIFSLIEDNG